MYAIIYRYNISCPEKYPRFKRAERVEHWLSVRPSFLESQFQTRHFVWAIKTGLSRHRSMVFKL